MAFWGVFSLWAEAKDNMSSQSKVEDTADSRGKGYFAESLEEVKKVSFPTRQETLQATFVTIAIMIVVSVTLFVLDFVIAKLMSALISTGA